MKRSTRLITVIISLLTIFVLTLTVSSVSAMEAVKAAESPWATYLVAWATLLLAIFTLLLVVANWKAASSAKEAAKHSETAAVASEKAAQTSHQTFEFVTRFAPQYFDAFQKAEQAKGIQWCVTEYHNIETDWQNKKIREDSYFDYLWTLHFAEFYLATLGFLPPHVYSAWILFRHNAYHGDNHIKEAEQWARVKKIIKDDDFANFVDTHVTKVDVKLDDVMKAVNALPARNLEPTSHPIKP